MENPGDVFILAMIAALVFMFMKELIFTKKDKSDDDSPHPGNFIQNTFYGMSLFTEQARRFWIWFLVSGIIFVLSAISQTILVRPTEFSWLKVHILFWLTRDVPLGIWGVLWWIRPFWKNESRLAKVFSVYGGIFSVIMFWLLFRLARMWAFYNKELFYGNPNKPPWFFW